MANFALSGPIFKIRNSKQVYSKSYKQLSVCQNIQNSLRPSVAWSRFYSILGIPIVNNVEILEIQFYFFLLLNIFWKNIRNNQGNCSKHNLKEASYDHEPFSSRDVLFEFHLKFWNTASIGTPVRSLLHSGLEQIQEKIKVTKDPSMVLKVFGHTDFKMLKQKILAKHLFSKMYFYG